MSIPELADEPPDVRRQRADGGPHRAMRRISAPRRGRVTSTRSMDPSLIMALQREGHLHLEGRPPALNVLDDLSSGVCPSEHTNKPSYP